MDSNAKQRDKQYMNRKRKLLLEAQKYAIAIFTYSGEAINAIDLIDEIERALARHPSVDKTQV